MDTTDTSAPLVITIRSSTQDELQRAASSLDRGFDVGKVVAERSSGRLAFDPALSEVGFKVLVAVAPVVATKLIDWAMAAAKERRQRAAKGDPLPALVVEVNGQTISIKGTAKPAALRAALEAAIGVRAS